MWCSQHISLHSRLHTHTHVVNMHVCVCELLWPTNICANLCVCVDMFIIRKLIPLFTYKMRVAANWFSAKAFQAEASAKRVRERGGECVSCGEFLAFKQRRRHARVTWQKLHAPTACLLYQLYQWQLNFNCDTFQSEIRNAKKSKVEKLTKKRKK